MKLPTYRLSWLLILTAMVAVGAHWRSQRDAILAMEQINVDPLFPFA